jgi:hypothetical protein
MTAPQSIDEYNASATEEVRPVLQGRSPESWLAMQHNHDLWQARKRVDLSDVEALKVSAA